MTTTETANDGVEICSNYLTLIKKITGFRPRVSMMSAPNRKDGTMDTYATAEKRPDLALKVMKAQGERIETARLDKLEIREPEPWRRLRDYFTEDRLNNNLLVAAEKEVLEANGYQIETDYYMAFDIPPQKGSLEKAFFLFTMSKEEMPLENHLPEIRKIIS